MPPLPKFEMQYVMTIVRIFALFGKKKSQREGKKKKEELEILAQLIDYAALQQFAL